MISAAGRFHSPGGQLQAPRGPSHTGMGHQALFMGFMEELQKQQAKSCERNVDQVKRAGMSDHLTGKRTDETEKFVF